eukprot:5344801-Amphidinium_carterae.1
MPHEVAHTHAPLVCTKVDNNLPKSAIGLKPQCCHQSVLNARVANQSLKSDLRDAATAAIKPRAA